MKNKDKNVIEEITKVTQINLQIIYTDKATSLWITQDDLTEFVA